MYNFENHIIVADKKIPFTFNGTSLLFDPKAISELAGLNNENGYKSQKMTIGIGRNMKQVKAILDTDAILHISKSRAPEETKKAFLAAVIAKRQEEIIKISANGIDIVEEAFKLTGILSRYLANTNGLDPVFQKKAMLLVQQKTGIDIQSYVRLQ